MAGKSPPRALLPLQVRIQSCESVSSITPLDDKTPVRIGVVLDNATPTSRQSLVNILAQLRRDDPQVTSLDSIDSFDFDQVVKGSEELKYNIEIQRNLRKLRHKQRRHDRHHRLPILKRQESSCGSCGNIMADGWMDSDQSATPSPHNASNEEATCPLPDICFRKSDLLSTFYDALQNGGSLQLASEGVGGTYFLYASDKKTKLAVFKPMDEEPAAFRNPREEGEEDSEEAEALKKGEIIPGTCWRREIAAFKLDHKGFAKVPETTYAYLPATWKHFPQDKWGSLQRMVTWEGAKQMIDDDGMPLVEGEGILKAAADVLPGRFSVEDVHHIGILDIRLCNSDRHGGNILALVPETAGETIRLIPIDHAYVLPNNLADLDFEWEWWPQAVVPFTQASIAYIKKLNVNEDSSIAQRLGMGKGPIVLLKVWAPVQFMATVAYSFVVQAATMTLQTGTAAGLNLRQIAGLLRRQTLDEPSEVEKLLSQHSLENEGDVNWEGFLQELGMAVERVGSAKTV